MCKEYSGWTNYATWNVALWIDNDEYTSDYKNTLVQQARSEQELEEAVKSWVLEDLLPVPETGMASDIFGWATEQINWGELANNYWEDKEPEEDEDEETA
jgi:hypothetical protein